MIRQALILGAAGLLAGCTASTTNPQGRSASTDVTPPNVAGNYSSREAEMAAFAARTQRPSGNARQSNYDAVVMGNGAVMIVNPTDQSLSPGALWVNEKYVAQVPPIRPHATVTLDRGQFFDRNGHTMDWSAEKLDKLELQSGEQLYAVNGPAYANK
jgi:hypothetical protein